MNAHLVAELQLAHETEVLEQASGSACAWKLQLGLAHHLRYHRKCQLRAQHAHQAELGAITAMHEVPKSWCQ